MARKLTFGLTLVVLAVSLAGAQTRPEEPAESGTMRLLRDIAGGPTNQIATAMFSSGVRNCATRVDQISNFLTKGTKASALLFLPDRDPDNSMVSASLEVQAEATPRAYGSATFSPNTAIGCSAMYETVQYWPESCNAVAAKHFRGAVSAGSLGGEIAMLTIGPSARVFLMRATGSSCVSIKKEVIK
ncbi:MAG: hypothetical protein ABJB04_02220 [Betaproteobacteria bacterium]